MSIRWIRNVMVDGHRATLEIMLGVSKIADKCYVRIDNGRELWFTPNEDSRKTILRQGTELLQSQMQGKKILSTNGSEFTWN